jgi:hypothetical protein
MEKVVPPIVPAGKLPKKKNMRNQVLAILFWVAFSDYGPTFSPRTPENKDRAEKGERKQRETKTQHKQATRRRRPAHALSALGPKNLLSL